MNMGTRAANAMPAITRVISDSTKLKPREAYLARTDVFIASHSSPPAWGSQRVREPSGPCLLHTARIDARGTGLSRLPQKVYSAWRPLCLPCGRFARGNDSVSSQYRLSSL